LFLPAAAVASSPATDASASTLVRPVSSGLSSPRILRTADVHISPDFAQAMPALSEVVLKLTVDENGKAQEVRVVKSPNPLLDDRVVQAVQQFRWRPAKLDKQAIPVELTLNVEVQR
jgi:TonB family protein